MAKKKINPLLVGLVLVVFAFLLIPKKVVFFLLFLGGIALVVFAFFKTKQPTKESPDRVNAQVSPGVKAWAAKSTKIAVPQQTSQMEGNASVAETAQEVAVHAVAQVLPPEPVRYIPEKADINLAIAASKATPATSQTAMQSVAHADGLVSVSISVSHDTDYQIPTTPPGLSKGIRWIPHGESVTVGGVEIPGGLLYVGTAHQRYPEADPALINPRLPIASDCPDLSSKLMGYWPSYSTIPP